MSSGSLYEIDDSARDEFALCTTKAMWYGVMGKYLAGDFNQLFVADTIDLWRALFENQPGPLHSFFYGELCTSPDGTGDPDVLFSGSSVVSQALEVLNRLTVSNLSKGYAPEDEEYIGQAFKVHAELCKFLASAVAGSKAIVALWD